MSPDADATARHRLALALMLASGFAGLGYQVVWTQQCATWLGHEAASVLAVVAAFFGGLALGARVLGDRVARSPRPLHWYAGCEAVVALWCGMLAVAMAPAGQVLLALTGTEPGPFRQWAVAFGGSFLLLLPATATMGATLPAMARLSERLRGDGRAIGGLYAANTLGAVLGVLGCALVLLPTLGLLRTTAVCAALNLLCAAVAWASRSRWAAASAVGADGCGPAKDVSATRPAASAAPLPLLLPLAVTGALGIGYEVLVVRVLSQVAEDTVYTFALLLAVYLVGTALGAAAYARWLARRADVARLGEGLLLALALASLLGTGSLWWAEGLRDAAGQAWGGGRAGALAAEACLALAAFGLPTLAMGALFSHLAAQAEAAGIPLGRALAANTLGAALAPLLFGVLLAPALGPKAALGAVAAGYLLLLPWRQAFGPAWARRWPQWGVAAAIAGLAVAAPPLAFVDVPEGGRVLSYRDGVVAAVSVVADADGVARLRINNRQQEGSSATQRVDGRQALLPLLLHPAPRRALFLGLGTGITAATAALDPDLQVQAVELLPEVVEASRHFQPGLDGDGPGAALPSRLRVSVGDARRQVRVDEQRHDLIVSDNFHPARSGSGALYTVEHFRAVRHRLARGGLFCQWLPLHQMDLDTLRSIVRAFLVAYPRASAVLASNSLQTPVIGLVGREDDAGFDPQALQARLDGLRLPGRGAAAYGFEDLWAVLGSLAADAPALARFAGDAPANTDDLPVVAYRAPWATYAPAESPADRLLTLLGQWSVDPAQVLAPGVGSPAVSARLQAYWSARDRFIAAGRAVRPGADVRQMLAQVRVPLLAALQTSPDFRPAYDPLLRMALALAAEDGVGARELLQSLQRLQPTRAEAAQALARLAGAGTPSQPPTAR